MRFRIEKPQASGAENPIDRDFTAPFLTLQDTVLAALTSSVPLEGVMYLLCSEVERIAPEIAVAAIRIDEKGLMQPLAAPSFPKSYEESLRNTPINPAVGTCGAALAYGRPNLTLNIDDDAKWRELKHLVQPLELCTCWSHPIKKKNGQTVGSIAFYYRHPHEPNAFDHQLAELCVRLGALAFEHHELKEQAEKLAYIDPLTNLPNHVLINREADRILGEATEGAESFSLIHIDLDQFKSVNDSLGHRAGDEILYQAAQRLKSGVRGNDLLGRLGGDEFLALIRHDDEKQILTASKRILSTLRAPFFLSNTPESTIRLGASIGVATYPKDGKDIQTLLQCADMAMHDAKDSGGHQIRFYNRAAAHSSAKAHPVAVEPLENDAGKSIALYGDEVSDCLLQLSLAIRPALPAIVDDFYEEIAAFSSAKHLIACLAFQEWEHLKEKQAENLALLCSPSLTPEQHESVALRLGRIHALSGLDRATLAQSHDALHATVLKYINVGHHSQAVSILARRLIKELAWQLQAAGHLQMTRQHVIEKIRDLCWRAHNYTDLITKVADILANYEEIAGCAFIRPDEQRIFRAEAMSGDRVHALLERVEKQQQQWLIMGHDPMKPGPAQRAWKTRLIERCLNYATDENAKDWRPLIEPAGFRSNAAIPLVSPDGRTPVSLLILYSQYPGGFPSQEQDSFLAQIQSLLTTGIGRLSRWHDLSSTVPFFQRQRWITLLERDGLEMHYQPIVDLRTRRITKVEALARLRDGGRILAPAQFFPALTSENFFQLYAKGLNQALKQRENWLKNGIELDIAINIPTAALEDTRYAEVTERALREYLCPPRSLTLETLETEQIPIGVNPMDAWSSYQKLGVNLAEDDLGSGYSSLARLREIPYNIIKIDRSIVGRTELDPFHILRFVYQLTRLGHSLGKKVVAEGIEDQDLLEAIALLETDYVQGYVIARPMPAHALAAWLETFRLSLDQHDGKAFLKGRPMVMLAQFLIWEETLHLLLQESLTLPSGRITLRDAHACLMAMPLSAPEASVIKSAVIDAATASGLHSQHYVQTRERLINAILAETLN